MATTSPNALSSVSSTVRCVLAQSQMVEPPGSLDLDFVLRSLANLGFASRDDAMVALQRHLVQGVDYVVRAADAAHEVVVVTPPALVKLCLKCPKAATDVDWALVVALTEAISDESWRLRMEAAQLVRSAESEAASRDAMVERRRQALDAREVELRSVEENLSKLQRDLEQRAQSLDAVNEATTRRYKELEADWRRINEVKEAEVLTRERVAGMLREAEARRGSAISSLDEVKKRERVIEDNIRALTKAQLTNQSKARELSQREQAIRDHELRIIELEKSIEAHPDTVKRVKQLEEQLKQRLREVEVNEQRVNFVAKNLEAKQSELQSWEADLRRRGLSPVLSPARRSSASLPDDLQPKKRLRSSPSKGEAEATGRGSPNTTMMASWIAEGLLSSGTPQQAEAEKMLGPSSPETSRVGPTPPVPQSPQAPGGVEGELADKAKGLQIGGFMTFLGIDSEKHSTSIRSLLNDSKE
eukprot:m51a1_g3820 hypothetical protein (473) ;mRNA; f:279953-281631